MRKQYKGLLDFSTCMDSGDHSDRGGALFMKQWMSIEIERMPKSAMRTCGIAQLPDAFPSVISRNSLGEENECSQR
ncbi:unnamed protein product [Chondrus crispus]|uniref:Uncharacterized protein n=1 Tax=Chondrus crispus TaxID=2769 RepID=R7QPX6_CHOCR|nr:unnamed protein product [Chondrus crispus]CDF39511.1 unnamed protein product [Chondrus crispus]|eukprot:XP_005719422.1 unnamed protein product [Chondrus crispus]